MARERIWSLSWGSPVAGCRNAMATSDGKHEISHSTRVKSWQGFYLVHEWRWSPSLYRIWTVNNNMCKMNLQYAKSNKLYSVPESPYDTEANLYARCILALYTACPSASLVKRDLGVQISVMLSKVLAHKLPLQTMLRFLQIFQTNVTETL